MLLCCHLRFLTLSCAQRCRFRLSAQTTGDKVQLLSKQIKAEILSQLTQGAGVLWTTCHRKVHDKITGAGSTGSYSHCHSTGLRNRCQCSHVPLVLSCSLDACTTRGENGEKLGKLTSLVSEIHQGKPYLGKAAGLITAVHVQHRSV